jgi:hypothetical protein
MDNDSINSFGGQGSYSEEGVQHSYMQMNNQELEESKDNNDTAEFFYNYHDPNLSFEQNLQPSHTQDNVFSFPFDRNAVRDLHLLPSIRSREMEDNQDDIILSSRNLPPYNHLQVNFSLSRETQPAFEDQFEEIFSDIDFLLTKEIDKQLELKLILNQKKKLFEDHLRIERGRMKKEKKAIERSKERLGQLLSSEVIEMNIGGTHMIATTKETLCKVHDSALAAMFNGKHKLRTYKERVFIDRDGDAFCMMLSYLRSSKIPLFENKAEENLFYEELDYWRIPINPLAIVFEEFDPSWCAPTLKLTSKNCTVRKNDPLHGVIFCTKPITQVGGYVEFKVDMQGPLMSTKSSLFVGLVDRSLYRKDQLMSTYWKDSPSSFYCDVWSCRLEKVDENGKQIGTAAEYGCGCQEEAENYVGMLYNEDKETLSFYKNGYFMGIAFHNVPKDLYPAVDLWFENGYVEIVKRRQPKTKD